MSMAGNVIAYTGADSFDIILYLSRILQMLGRRVLIADYNEKFALTYSMPEFCGLDMEINTYMNVDFTRNVLNETVISAYDDVLIDCGFSEPVFDTSVLTKIIYVSDMFSFNLKRLRQICYYDDLPVRKELLIREASDISVTAEQMISILKKDISKIQLLYHDEGDYQNALICNYNQAVSFNGLSARFKNYLLTEIREMVKKLSDKQLKAAYNKAKKGKKGVTVYEHCPVLVTVPWAGANK